LIEKTGVRNRILKALSDDDFSLVAPHLDLVPMPNRFKVASPGQPLDYLYFPESGIGAVMSLTPNGESSEAGMFGVEGFVPTSTIIGDNLVPYDIEMKVGGAGYRMPIRMIAELMAKSASLHVPFVKYMHVFAVQVAFTALANARFTIDQRLARWILMCQDRIGHDTLEITHEYIAMLLSTRRPSVTNALHVLEGERLIRSSRGIVAVVNRKGLERFSRGCYGVPEHEFERLIGDR